MESLICTVFNEEKSLPSLLDSILAQTKLPGEVIFVDGGSSDKTLKILHKYKSAFHSAGIDYSILERPGNRSVGRNFAIQSASADIILVTDAGCVLDTTWVQNITQPFRDKNIDVVSGYYRSWQTNSNSSDSIFQKCLGVYTSTMPDRLRGDTFLPSSRSVAFRKKAWEEVGGYNEELDTAEDLMFAKSLKENGAQFTLAQNAQVYWPQKTTLWQACKQFFGYARGDGQSFNIRPSTPFVFGRYIVGLLLAVIAVVGNNVQIASLLGILVTMYIVWSIAKNYRYIKEWQAFYILPALQIVSDLALMTGMTAGFISSPVIKNASIQILGRLITAILGFVTTALLARHLDPQGFGEYSYIFSLSTMAFLAADLGLDTYLIRTTAQKFSKKAFQTVLTVRVLSMFAIYGILALFMLSSSLPYTARTGVMIASLSSMLLLLTNVIWSVYKGQLKYRVVVTAQIITATFIAALTFYGVRQNLSLPIFIIFHVFGFLGGFAFSLYCWDRPYSLFELTSRDIRSLLTTLWPYIGIFVFATAYFKIDVLILGFFHPPQTSTAVGLYSLAYRPFEVAIVLIGYFTQTLLPYFSMLKAVPKNAYLKLSFLLALLTGLTLFLAAPVYVSLIGGDAFSQAILPTQILSLAALFTIVGGYYGSKLLAENKEKKVLIISIFALVVNIVLNFIFTPEHSYIATSWITVVTQLVVLVGYTQA